MTGAYSRNKGARGELELCKLLSKHLGGKYTRNLKQYQQSQEGDIAELVCGLLIECKNCKALEIPSWWRQAVAAAQLRGATPCLAYKVARKGWKFILPTDDAIKAAQSWSFDLRYTQELYEDGFFLRLRELGG
ncbi:MAG TPA: hypothetical protein VEY92_08520 [Pseudoxanthomonas sp.]|nr:hypothetical protein [Pseudoxanthomonas sp.]